MYYRVAFRVPGFSINKFSFFIFSSFCGQGLEMLLYACVQEHKFPVSDFIQAPLFKKTNTGINSFSYVTSKLRNYIFSPTYFDNSTNKGYCHLLVENLNSNFVADTLCSRGWIFLSCCDNGAAVLSRYVRSKADNPLGYCSNRLQTPEDKKRLINPVQHWGSFSGVQTMLSSPYT